jgi:uncharacterized protein (DUF58 family)
MYRSSHLGADEVDNTEELGVRVAASLISRLDDLSMPVGLAANAERAYMFRPDSSPAQAGKLMEALATMRASGNVSLERFIYDLRSSLSRFNTLTVITPSRRTEWISALSSLRRQGVGVAVMYIDPVEFGAPSDAHSPLELLFMNDIPTYMLKRGQPINEALRAPLQRAAFATYVPAGPSSKEEATV